MGVVAVSSKNSILCNGIKQCIYNKKFLSKGNIKGEEGLDPDINKFVVNPTPLTSLFSDSGAMNPLVVNRVEVDPCRKYGMSAFKFWFHAKCSPSCLQDQV